MEILRPLWTPQSIDMVRPYLDKKMKVFEWGSGSSTIWFAKKTEFVWTLESSLEWNDRVAKWIAERNLDNVVQIVRDITSGDYMLPIMDMQDKKFDVILVDGAFRRVEAFERSVPKLKHNGIMLLDDSQNYSWRGAFEIPNMEVVDESLPDKTGKKMTIFRRV